MIRKFDLLFTETADEFEGLQVPIYSTKVLNSAAVSHKKLCATAKCSSPSMCTDCIFFGLNDESFDRWLNLKLNK